MKAKKIIIILLIIILASLLLILIFFDIKKYEKSGIIKNTSEAASEQIKIETYDNNFSVEFSEDDSSVLNLEKGLKPVLEQDLKDAGDHFLGEWSAYVCVPSENQSIVINDRKMQAASTIKLYVMGKVYDEYDDITKRYGKKEVDSLVKSMITLSDNEDTDELVYMLGRGKSADGLKKVTEYCKSLSLNNSSMGRMMQSDNNVSDNYTSSHDLGIFLEMILNDELPHSNEMLDLLKAQTRKSKIPDGIPSNVMTANKTGELDDVENDAAIIFTEPPYIFCIMSDGMSGYQAPIDLIADMSTDVYNYIAPRV